LGKSEDPQGRYKRIRVRGEARNLPPRIAPDQVGSE